MSMFLGKMTLSSTSIKEATFSGFSQQSQSNHFFCPTEQGFLTKWTTLPVGRWYSGVVNKRVSCDCPQMQDEAWSFKSNFG